MDIAQTIALIDAGAQLVAALSHVAADVKATASATDAAAVDAALARMQSAYEADFQRVDGELTEAAKS